MISKKSHLEMVFGMSIIHSLVSVKSIMKKISVFLISWTWI